VAIKQTAGAFERLKRPFAHTHTYDLRTRLGVDVNEFVKVEEGLYSADF